ncbi:MAG: VOC family protein [Acidimicrobiia bacterium]|nr:VOC family protein [Acidimicrobiia bacterium]
MANKIVHWELMGPDADALSAFYAELFDWKGEAVPGFDGYNMVHADQAGVGGAVGKGNEHMPQYQAIYVEVEDVNTHLGKAESAGGTTVVPRTVIPGMVTFGLFTDPAGNLVGIVEAGIPPAE